MRRGEDERPGSHDGHPDGDVARLGGAGPTAQVGDGDDGDEGADVVGAGDDAGLGRLQAEATLDGRDHHVGEDHALRVVKVEYFFSETGKTQRRKLNRRNQRELDLTFKFFLGIIHNTVEPPQFDPLQFDNFYKFDTFDLYSLTNIIKSATKKLYSSTVLLSPDYVDC